MTVNDLDLLAEYTRKQSDSAFAALVGRHLNLVYSAALRQVRSIQLAEEVAQSVFLDLARSAPKLKPDTILTAWLYQVTRRTAIDVVRRESRRQARERLAAEMAPMNTTAGWMQIEPVLDEAMDALDETDRAAILLRFFENKSLREVGATLGTSDDAAQKRVSRAVERLRDFFAKRGVTIGAGGLVALITANAVQAAPAGLAGSISTAAALVGTAITATTTTTQAIVMTTFQKVAIAATLAAAIGGGIYEARQAAGLRTQNDLLLQQQAHLAKQIQQLQQERDNASNRLASLAEELANINTNNLELLKLRGEVTRLRGSTPPQSNDPLEADMKSWLARTAKLKERLAETPAAQIPEFRLLNDRDFMDAAKWTLNTEGDYLRTFSNLRSTAEFRFITTLLNPALTGYAKANNGQFPTDIVQLQPYFPSPVEEAILDRWQVAPAKTVRTDNFGDPIITEKAAVDADFDPHFAVGLNGFASAGIDTSGHNGWGSVFPDVTLAPAFRAASEAYQAANNGKQPGDLPDIFPFLNLTTADQQAAYEKMMKWRQKK